MNMGMSKILIVSQYYIDALKDAGRLNLFYHYIKNRPEQVEIEVTKKLSIIYLIDSNLKSLLLVDNSIPDVMVDNSSTKLGLELLENFLTFTKSFKYYYSQAYDDIFIKSLKNNFKSIEYFELNQDLKTFEVYKKSGCILSKQIGLSTMNEIIDGIQISNIIYSDNNYLGSADDMDIKENIQEDIKEDIQEDIIKSIYNMQMIEVGKFRLIGLLITVLLLISVNVWININKFNVVLIISLVLIDIILMCGVFYAFHLSKGVNNVKKHRF